MDEITWEYMLPKVFVDYIKKYIKYCKKEDRLSYGENFEYEVID